MLGCLLMGLVNGQLCGRHRGDMVSQAETITYLAVTPFLVVNAIKNRGAVRMFAIGAGVMAVVKGSQGDIGWVLGKGSPFGSTVLTYLEPTANWLMLLFLLTLLVAVIHRVPTARWTKWGSLFVLAAFVLSFRRSFWIGGALGFILVLMFATGRRGGRVLLPGGRRVRARRRRRLCARRLRRLVEPDRRARQSRCRRPRSSSTRRTATGSRSGATSSRT